MGVVHEDGIEYGIGNLVCQFVRMALRNRF